MEDLIINGDRLMVLGIGFILWTYIMNWYALWTHTQNKWDAHKGEK